MARRTRMEPLDRKNMIVLAAVSVGNNAGVDGISFEAVAKCCPVHTTIRNVRHYFPKKRDLWIAVGNHARCNKELRDMIVAIGLVKL